MTAIGLAVAVPAVLGYNWLVRRNKAAMDDVRAFGNDLHAVILLAAPRKRPGDAKAPAMAMSVGPADGDEDEVISAINTTPLVDVMLVLLIIFLITIPVVTTSIPVRAAQGKRRVRETKPENIVISVDRGRQHLLVRRCASPDTERAGRPAEEGLGDEAAARSADPRRPGRAVRRRRQDPVCLPARRHHQGRLHHRAAAARQ